jgi:hypothetical protein
MKELHEGVNQTKGVERSDVSVMQPMLAARCEEGMLLNEKEAT